jgi:NlpC/P60 family putative phage cell wall peptidase
MTKEQEKAEREKLIAEAREWIGTPYVTRGRVKQGGCDCGTFLAGVLENAGFLPHIDIPYYSEDVACHCAVPRYLMKIKEYYVEIPKEEAIPGDIFVFQFPGSKVPHHASIMMDKDFMIHAYTRQGVILSNIKGYTHALSGAYRFKRWAVE